MGDQVKKISFGFSKLAKKTAIVSSQLSKNKEDDNVAKVEFIDCLEGKSIKLKDPVKLEQGPLIIPLSRQKEEKSSSQQVNLESTPNIDVEKKLSNKNIQEPCETAKEGGANTDNVSDEIKIQGQSKDETLDEIAAREILAELNKKKTEDEEKRIFSVPLTSNAPSGEAESTQEDYDNIPVTEFGMAMLRGMGWAPGKGIGKTEKFVTPSLPKLRPKGMGLGADKVIAPVEKQGSNENLEMVTGSFVRVIAGSEKDSYGQIEGFDDESGRVIIKLALKNVSVSLNEFMVQLVEANEFKKNSKVINVSKYEQYKEKEVKKETSDRKLDERVLGNTHKRESGTKSPPVRSNSDKLKGRSIDSPKSYVKEDKNFKDGEIKGSSDLSPSRSSRDKHRKERSRSHSRSRKSHLSKSETGNKHCYDNYDKKPRSYSSDSADSSSSSKITNKNTSKGKNRIKDRSESRRRSRSNSSSSSGGSRRYSMKEKKRHKKNKSRSYKSRSRSRSRSPRKHKHKRSKKYS